MKTGINKTKAGRVAPGQFTAQMRDPGTLQICAIFFPPSICSTLQMEVPGCSETLIINYKIRRRHIPQHSNIYSHRSRNLSLNCRTKFNRNQ
jgi:hypothetical protein